MIPVKATRPSAAQVANPGWGLGSGLIGGVDIYQGVVGDVGGSWYGGWWHDDGNVVGGDAPNRNRSALSLSLLSTLAVRPYPVPAASGRNGNTCGSGRTPTTAPKPPHTTCPNPCYRGRVPCASAQCSLNASGSQPWSAHQGAGGGGGSRCIAQAWQGNTPRTPTLWPVECEAWEAINRRRVGTPVRPGGEIRSIGGAPAGARSFASDRGWRRLDWKRMGGHMRGRMTRACGKADERTIDESIDGGCTLSHETVVKYQPFNRTPDSSGGIKSISDVNQNTCEFRPGGGY